MTGLVPTPDEATERSVRIRFPAPLWADLHTLAERDERSFNGEVVYLLRRAVRAELEAEA